LPLSVLLAAAVLSVALGCATGTAPVADAQANAGDAETTLEKQPRTPRTYRLGIWEFDLLALDLEPRGTTFRMLDFKILKLLEIGGGEDYHSVSLVEMPVLLNVLTTRHEGPVHEHRLVDVQALALAMGRYVKESARELETHLLKIPVVGSLYGYETDGAEKKHTVLYLVRWETER
jgi:hypothetical protein